MIYLASIFDLNVLTTLKAFSSLRQVYLINLILLIILQTL